MKHLLQKEYLFDPFFSFLNIFAYMKMSQIYKFLGFSEKQITDEMQNQNMVPDFSVT